MKFFKPENPIEAVKTYSENPGAVFLAGGTYINSLYGPETAPAAVISLEKLGLDEISEEKIGAMATLEGIRISRNSHPSLKEAASHVANRNIRNLATIGGNIAANKSSSDMIGVLIALKASVIYFTPEGKKELPAASWISEPDGLITGFTIRDTARNIYQKRFSRTKNDLPILKVVIGTAGSRKIFKDTVITAGSISKQVIILEKASQYLNGKEPGSVKTDRLFEIAQKEINPVDDQRASEKYRRHLLNTALEDFLKESNDGD
jgi:putative selenate reductase FAD-binding subunit